MTTTTDTPVDTSADATPPAGPWGPDLLEGYERRALTLDAAPLDPEPEAPVVATLVRRAGATKHPYAVLHVHGWNDYFFHTHVVDGFDEHGVTCYGIDLRRCGRSRAPGQLTGYVDSMDDYFADLDAALDLLAADHEHLILSGHSTGGLVVSLYADARPQRLAAVILNSPWLDLWGPPGAATALKAVLDTVGRRDPYAVVPLTAGDSLYAQVMHERWGGPWNYSLELKSPAGVPVRFGWLRAVMDAHARVAKGLAIDCPVFMATAERSWFVRRVSKKARSSDIVLDVSRISARAWRLGPSVMLVRIHDGVHDLFLSAPAARRQLYDHLDRWLRAFVRVDAEA